ncbi:hypothetical protein KA405_01920 [Patescibacteria group bacterium]|nr:hypothetical protein [Patescibacteria group bacterium]
MQKNFLQVGDVFKATYPMRVYFSKDGSNIEVSLFPDFNTLTDELEKNFGKELKAFCNVCKLVDWDDIQKLIRNGYNRDQLYAVKNTGANAKFLCGEYVVTATSITGGGTGHATHDIYSDGHRVTAKKLKKNGSWDPNGKEISFYQSGSFTCVNTDVEVVREMKMSFA